MQAPSSVAVPKGPTDEQRREHELQGHVKYESWCPRCVAGKGREVAHRRDRSEHEYANIYMGHSFLDNEGAKKQDATGQVKVVALADGLAGYDMAMVIESKGRCEHAASNIAAWLDRLGHERIILQCGPELAVKALCNMVKERASCDTVLRATIAGEVGRCGR